MNTTRGPLRDVRVRRALNLATDVETILKTQMAGRGVRAAGAIPPGIMGYDSTRAPYPWDTAARGGCWPRPGTPSGFRLQLWRSKRAELVRIAQSVQQDLAPARHPGRDRRARRAERAGARFGTARPTSTWATGTPTTPTPRTSPTRCSTRANRGPGGNYAFLADAGVDAMIAAARSTPDTLEKARLSREIDARVFDLAPWIFLWFPVDVWAMQPDVKGWRIPAVFTGQRWTTVERVP